MLRLVLGLSVFIFCLANTYAQRVTVSGYVTDVTNSERLIGATVLSDEKNKVSSTNDQGFYSITLQQGSVTLRVSYVGFKPAEINLELTHDTLLNLSLTPNSSLDEVVITSNTNRQPPNIKKISIAQLAKLPVLVGEPDVMKTLQLMPGVQTGTEGHTGLYIKGGDDDQNLVLVDGVPVYNPNHLFGFFSIFNERAIQDITVYQGNFPAKYGGRLSSVVDIQTKEGNAKKIEGSVSIGAVATSMNLEGPLFSKKTTFFVSGRGSYLEALATPIVKHFTQYNAAGFRFYDCNGKITHRFNNKHKLIFSHYRSYDYGFTDEERQQTTPSYSTNFKWEETTSWGNQIYSLAWNYAITHRLFLNTVTNYSNYNYLYDKQNNYSTNNNNTDNYFNGFSSDILDKGLRTNLSWYVLPKSTIRVGIGYNQLTFKPSVEATRISNMVFLDQYGNIVDVNIDTIIGGSKIKPKEASAYIENEIKLGENLIVTPGLRYVNFQNNCTYNVLEPRLNVSWQIGKTGLHASYAETNQFNHLLETSKISQSTDLWVPSTKTIKPERSRQVSISISHPITKGVEFSAEAYYKSLSNLVDYQDGASYFSSATSWEDKVTFGKGKSYGLILTIEKKAGKTTGWISYTLSKSVRKFDELNSGNEFPFAYSRPHDLKFVVMHQFSKKFDVSGTWVYHSGNNQTFGDVKYWWTNVYLQRNSYRLSDYHRMDVNFNYHIQTRHLTHTISLGAYNAYNRRNIYNVEYYRDLYNSGYNYYYTRERPLFPIIPSFTYRIKF